MPVDINAAALSPPHAANPLETPLGRQSNSCAPFVTETSRVGIRAKREPFPAAATNRTPLLETFGTANDERPQKSCQAPMGFISFITKEIELACYLSEISTIEIGKETSGPCFS
jgi:hypothetical protein